LSILHSFPLRTELACQRNTPFSAIFLFNMFSIHLPYASSSMHMIYRFGFLIMSQRPCMFWLYFLIIFLYLYLKDRFLIPLPYLQSLIFLQLFQVY
jgi:hypothetical protein